MELLAFHNNFMGPDGLVILVVGLLLFARRFPRTARNLHSLTAWTKREFTHEEVLLLVALLLAVLLLLLLANR